MSKLISFIKHCVHSKQVMLEYILSTICQVRYCKYQLHKFQVTCYDTDVSQIANVNYVFINKTLIIH